MNLEIADLANRDLKNATRVLWYSTTVLKNLPLLHVSQEDRAAIYEAASHSIRAVRFVLANIADQLAYIEATEG